MRWLRRASVCPTTTLLRKKALLLLLFPGRLQKDGNLLNVEIELAAFS
jgi:hypothetical protein